ncbi:hypothetical protein AB0M02_44985 [Actinoplanes sp. NPDC051861]|uniref:hypothetical protein n=1 Tax=Actinoplanes sp. NPDC051861 TaxID=3155170 RepID=UPI0034424C89
MPLRFTEPRTVIRDFGPTWVWREDLVEIVSVMRQVAPDLTLRADNYSLDEVNDLDGLTARLVSTFAATSGDSRIRLVLSPEEASISADDPDLPTRGMLEEVHRIATRHQRVKHRERGLVWGLGASAAVVVLSVATLPLWGDFRIAGLVALMILAKAIMVASGLIFGGKPRRLAVVHVQTRTDDPLWINRNRDALVTNAIVSAVFLLVGIVLGKITESC